MLNEYGLSSALQVLWWRSEPVALVVRGTGSCTSVPWPQLPRPRKPTQDDLLQQHSNHILVFSLIRRRQACYVAIYLHGTKVLHLDQQEQPQ